MDTAEERSDASYSSTSQATDSTNVGRNFLVPEAPAVVQVTQVYKGDSHVVGEAPATLRAASEDIEVYVDEAFWGTQVTAPQLNSFMQRLVEGGVTSGFRPDLGVFATNELVFGSLRRERLPNGKQRVFVVDTAGAGDGYLCGWCEYPDLHLDGKLVGPLDGDVAASISAHELFHAIHRGYDADEEVWLDETLAEAAMSVNGLFTDVAWLGSYIDNPNVAWGPHGSDIASVHYGACLAFGTYLWEQGGSEFMRAATAEPLNGWAGLDAALSKVGEARSAWELFVEMGAALYYDHPERGLGFASFDFVQAVPSGVLRIGSTHAVSLQPFGLVHLTSEVGGRLRVQTQSIADVSVGFVDDALPTRLVRTLQPNQPFDVSAGLVVIASKATTTVNVSFE